MKISTTLAPRTTPDGSKVTDDALKGVADDIKTKGTIVVRDLEGTAHHCKVTDVAVTDRGVEATIEFDPTKSTALTDALYGGSKSTMSMGCKIAEPPPCSICNEEG